MKTLTRFVMLLIVSFILYAIKMPPNQELMHTLFTVTGILFSIGLSLIITIDLRGIETEKILGKIKGNLDAIRNRYISLFVLSTVCFIITESIKSNNFIFEVQLSTSFSLFLNLLFCSFSLSLLLFAIIYFIVNFLDIQKLKDDINKQIHEEKEISSE